MVKSCAKKRRINEITHLSARSRVCTDRDSKGLDTEVGGDEALRLRPEVTRVRPELLDLVRLIFEAPRLLILFVGRCCWCRAVLQFIASHDATLRLASPTLTEHKRQEPKRYEKHFPNRCRLLFVITRETCTLF